ncbi:tetratricopeptide repeat protein [Neptuniibacter sp.]|uniref:YfgM family protein n=1 Tax=Neptuniibacter sp. TaxID=1962643 RepID=UPI002615A458|nr:tetratricopeptide repeat protein [Neptuniibacter sp.]MCP4598920.1 tetratricopeptide repeat protein [Neptuniibacter sp.]
MAELRTEEEQVQALKNWWNENGKSLLLGVAVALAGIFGWKGWQQQQAVQSENASILYQNMLDAVVGAIGPQQDEAQLVTAKHLAEELKTDYDSSSYAKYAAMIMARVAVDNNELDKAVTELDWVLANQPTESMFALASLRKARVLAAQGEVDKALSIVSGAPVAGYKASISELKGDLYLAKGDKAQARSAYSAALEASEVNSRPVLKMKLDDLAVEGS